MGHANQAMPDREKDFYRGRSGSCCLNRKICTAQCPIASETCRKWLAFRIDLQSCSAALYRTKIFPFIKNQTANTYIFDLEMQRMQSPSNHCRIRSSTSPPLPNGRVASIPLWPRKLPARRCIRLVRKSPGHL